MSVASIDPQRAMGLWTGCALSLSGSTMNAITGVLLNKGEAATVRVFIIAKTRSKQ